MTKPEPTGSSSYTEADAWRENYEGMFWRWAECDAERRRLKDELEAALLRLRCADQDAPC